MALHLYYGKSLALSHGIALYFGIVIFAYKDLLETCAYLYKYVEYLNEIASRWRHKSPKSNAWGGEAHYTVKEEISMTVTVLNCLCVSTVWKDVFLELY